MQPNNRHNDEDASADNEVEFTDPPSSKIEAEDTPNDPPEYVHKLMSRDEPVSELNPEEPEVRSGKEESEMEKEKWDQ